MTADPCLNQETEHLARPGMNDGLRRRHSAPSDEEEIHLEETRHVQADGPSSASVGAGSISPRSIAAFLNPDGTSRSQSRRRSPDKGGHVRFSSEVDREEARRSSTSLSTSPTPRGPAAVAGQGLASFSQRPGTPNLRIDTLRAGSSTAVDRPIASAGASPRSPASPKSPQKPATAPALSPATARARGYSLRRTIFSKNIGSQEDSPHGSVIELAEAGPSNGRELGSSHSGNGAQKKSMDSTVTVVQADTAELGADGALDRKISGLTATRRPSQLPHYESWMQEKAARKRWTRRFKLVIERLRKIILRISEIPSTQDGRHIDVDAQRKDPLIDERTNRPYIDNTIRSSRYNAWNFLPRQLWAQFSKLANAYFLFVAILQMIPGLSTTGTYTTIIPLLFFVTISMAKEGYDDWRRYRLDKEENNRLTQLFRAYQPLGAAELDPHEPATPNSDPRVWADVKWKDVRVGDIVRLQRDQQIPADLVLLHSEGENNTAYIETMALDGETNLKSKSPVPSLAKTCDTLDKLGTCNAHVVVEDPNLDLYNFEGRVTVAGDTAPLSNGEVIYRGSVLRNTSEAVGLVIYSGEECKIRMNASKNPRIKAPTLQFLVNKIIIAMVAFVIALSLFNTIAYQVWSAKVEDNAWYLSKAGVDFMPILVSFIIMFNTLIPLSLYVSLEIIKLFQRLLLNDLDMYDEESDTPMEARTSTINEELGQVSYIFSDKTGTLTDNSMKFRKLSVAGTAWLHDSDLKLDAVKDAERQRLRRRRTKGKNPAHLPRQRSFQRSKSPEPPRKSMSAIPAKTRAVHSEYAMEDEDATQVNWKSSARPTKSQPEMHTIEMLRYIQRRPFTIFAKKARFFLLSIALCHTCLPETKADGSISFQAASPDELALVQAAQELGYMLVDRQSGILTIKTFPRGYDSDPQLEKHEVLNVIEFSSKRKRMSVIVRFPDRRICVVSKGADSVIMNLLRLSALAQQKSVEVERRASMRKSVEAQQAIARRSEHMEPSGSPHPRSSVGGVGRASVSGSRSAYRNQLDSWLREREIDVDASAMDDQAAYTPRPSGQFARPSMAASSTRSSFQTEDLDYELVEESLAIDEPAIIERCLQHINDFATEGLRTLLYGYRFVTEDEYQTWHKVYKEATTSLADRQREIERAGDLIEHSFELAGATAIEDKLQKGVPEAIDKLRRAGIKMWMLTGDKRETAINIGHSCRLIKDYSSVTILDQEDPYLEQLLASTIVAITPPTTHIAHSVAVIDGATLSHIEASPTLISLFLDLSPLVDSLICCRASPSQKASLVRSVRTKIRKSITLAIGDGANDIAMIQEAHVGIGITGKEGLQAARTSDYSIAQFRFLVKLLLVHGRWNYIRTARYTAATFWKEMLFYLTQALYQRYAGYTGTSFYENWSLTTFNTLFTSLPVIVLGVFEKDLLPQTLLAVPELYASMGLRNAAFNWSVYAFWIFRASAEAMLVFFVMYAVYGSDDGSGTATHIINSLSGSGRSSSTTAHNSPPLATYNATSGSSHGIFALSSLTFTAIIIIISATLQGVEMHNVSLANAISFFLSVGGWFLWNILLSVVYADNTIYHVRGGFLTGFGRDPAWWATLLLILIAVGAFELGWRGLKWVIGGLGRGSGRGSGDGSGCGDSWSWNCTVGRTRWGRFSLPEWCCVRFRISLPGPSDADVFQVFERDPVMRARFEDAARGEMAVSLGAGAVDAGDESLKGVGGDGFVEPGQRRDSERRREGEIEELLRRRGLRDDDTTDTDEPEDPATEFERQRLKRVVSGRSQSLGV